MQELDEAAAMLSALEGTLRDMNYVREIIKERLAALEERVREIKNRRENAGE